jgi:hypothetical protein
MNLNIPLAPISKACRMVELPQEEGEDEAEFPQESKVF